MRIRFIGRRISSKNNFFLNTFEISFRLPKLPLNGRCSFTFSVYSVSSKVKIFEVRSKRISLLRTTRREVAGWNRTFPLNSLNLHLIRLIVILVNLGDFD